ncbi:MAG: acyltransferase [Bacteroidota bacterium]
MTPGKLHKISWKASVVLDAMRLSAAMLVFLHHVYSIWFNDVVGDKLVSIAHYSVVIFFVLSGYLIAYTTANNNRGVIQYAQSRLGRLYSILLPALFITAICQLTIFYTNPAVHEHFSRPPVALRYGLSAVFLNEVWFLSAAPAINSPLWSMSYEFWYYVIFGLWFFLKKSWLSYVIILGAILVAGPSILAMMPIWIMGCLAYKMRRLQISNKTAWLLFLLGMSASLLLLEVLPSMPFAMGQAPLHFANQFVTDIIIGFFVAVALFGISHIRVNTQAPSSIISFRKIADLTFPLYLLHYPLLVLWQSFFATEKGNIIQFGIAVICILSVIVVLGLFLESKRNWWNNIIGYLLKSISNIRFIKTRHAQAIK